ncbi:MAG: CoA transferase [Acidobacteriia bacterium]|nr:CoA transferase [Terriglobia bacterium]
MTENKPILAGLRVIDAATYIAAPSAAAILGDFGADVIKIERPPHGDPFRYLHHLAGMPECDEPYPWIQDNRNKRSLALDLSLDQGRDVLVKLVRRADVFVTNYQPPLLEQFRLRYEDLQELNPRLVFASITGYGETGEEAAKPGYDMTAYFARSGLMHFIHNADAEPSLSPCGFGDHPSAMTLFAGIMMALYRRQLSGEGSKVTTTLMANGVWANASLMQGALMGARFRDRVTRQNPHNPLVNHYQSGDGKRFLFCLLDPLKDWGKLCAAMQRPDLLLDERFLTPSQRRDHSSELVLLLDEEFTRRKMDEWERRFAAHDVLYGAVPSTEDASRDPRMMEQGVFVDFKGVPGRTIDSPLQVDGCPKSPPQAIAGIGEHTREILEELEYGCAEIDSLFSTGVVT